ncbi:CYFA0S18e01728g1_1 [Cyberlindnera fabianii]|uniref:CYFA0S18e01728g1_1 n=1 Tax=Cyberlindnera fabianii TaxID=36022 RepID=A0A061BER2_CYBFA|nr:hypothetical protein BON22_1105 [Cyberlindnera fabianii]CDR45438.1 CYFA0S18e01728g1_1 [Cyberlindnera fabianii]
MSTDQQIDSLIVQYKRRGFLDTQKKKLREDFVQSTTHDELISQVKLMTTKLIEAKPDLLLRKRGHLTSLIDGAITRRLSGSGAGSSEIPLEGVEELGELIDSWIKEHVTDSEDLQNEVVESLQTTKAEKEAAEGQVTNGVHK